MASGHLSVALSDGTKLEIPCEQIVRQGQATLKPAERVRTGIDYRSQNDDQGFTWEPVRDLSGGCGGFLATKDDTADSRYGIGVNFDALYRTPGPAKALRLSGVADYPGIPDAAIIIQDLQVGTTQFVLTNNNIYSLYRKLAGATYWQLVGGGYTTTLASVLPGWGALSTAVPKCMVALNDTVAVGFGSGTAFVFSNNSLDHSTDMSWTASAKASNAKYMDVAISDQYTVGATSAVRAIYGVQTTAGGETFFCTSLKNAGTDTASVIIGDTTDDTMNSVVMAEDGLLVWGKRRDLWEVSSSGAVTRANKKSAQYKALTETGMASYIPQNYRKVVKLSSGYIYWLLGDYHILEREPVNGGYRYFSLKDYGVDTPIMQLPITAMCAGPDDELYIAVGTTAKSTHFSMSGFPAGEIIEANKITDGTTYAFKGKYRTVESSGQIDWVWHGYVLSVPMMVQHMWWTPDAAGSGTETPRLFLCSGEAIPQSGSPQSFGYVRHTVNNGGAFTDADSLQSETQYDISSTGTAAGGDYFYIGHAATFRGVTIRLVSSNSTANALVVEYYNGSTWTSVAGLDDDTSTGTISLAYGGLVSWTMPSDWATTTVNGQSAYWVRWYWTVAHDATTILQGLHIAYNAMPSWIVGEGNPLLKLDTSSVRQTADTSMLETGLFTDNRPNVLKVARKGEGRVSGVAASNPAFVVKYRTVEDDDTSSALSTLGTYTTNALARAGTTFTDNVTNHHYFYGMRLQLQFVPSTTTPTAAQLYSYQVTYLDNQTVRESLSFQCKAVNGIINRQGVRSGVSMKELVAFLYSWRDASDPVATVTDVETQESWSMRLLPTSPRVTGTEHSRMIECSAVEVV